MLVTVAVSLLVFIAKVDAQASYIGGFVAARLSGVVDFTGYDFIPAILTPLTCTLLHANLLHLGMNVLMLIVTGRPTEEALGARGIVILYLVGAYAAAAAQWAGGPESLSPMIGASGAASAVIGAYAMLFGQSRAKRIGPFSAKVVHIAWLAAAWTVINLMAAIALQGAGIAQLAAGAHIGGFVAGLLLARPLLLWRYRRA